MRTTDFRGFDLKGKDLEAYHEIQNAVDALNNIMDNAPRQAWKLTNADSGIATRWPYPGNCIILSYHKHAQGISTDVLALNLFSKNLRRTTGVASLDIYLGGPGVIVLPFQHIVMTPTLAASSEMGIILCTVPPY